MEQVIAAAVPALANAALKKGDQIVRKLTKSQAKKRERARIHRINGTNKRNAEVNASASVKPKPPAVPPKQKFKMANRVPVDIPSRRVFNTPNVHFQHKYTKRGNIDVMVIEGCDFYGSIGGNVGQYGELYNLPINPLAVPNTRLAIECQLWTKFNFEKLEFIYIPQKSTSTDGALLISHVDDPEIALPAPGNVGLAIALSSVANARPTQVFTELTHTFSPKKTDKREFYIWPDAQNEDRLTTQGEFKVIDMTGMNIPVMGLIYVRYKCELRERLISADATTMFPSNLTRSVVLTAAVANGAVQLTDNGLLGYLAITLNSGEAQFTVNTTYAAVFNFKRGDLYVMSYAYFHVSATMSSPCILYSNPADAQNSTSANKLYGSWASSSALPSNATMYAIIATSVPTPTKNSEAAKIQRMERELSDNSIALGELHMLLAELREKYIDAPVRTTTQLSTPKGGFVKSFGV